MIETYNRAERFGEAPPGFRRAISEILPETDLFLMTSQTKGPASSILDAVASRLPVVATEAGGTPKMVRHGETGLLAPIGGADALAKQVLSLLGRRIVSQSVR